ncbi:hypothetical protein MKX01_037589 [Papaver californicum]|nr:hypothetical protein MKX01_037589 [Papaver californicum]
MMMSGRSSKLTGAFLLSVVVIFAVLVSECLSSRVQPDYRGDVTYAYLENDISENILLYFHCYSSETDFGDHTLTYGHEFIWSFRIDAFFTTKYWCDMRFDTEEGKRIQGGFDVYMAKRDYKQCENECHYSVRKDGLYRRKYEDNIFSYDLLYGWP